MLSQLAKLATKLDSFGLQKEADVLDAFIKRAADPDSHFEEEKEGGPSSDPYEAEKALGSPSHRDYEEEDYQRSQNDEVEGDSRTEKENRLSRLIASLSDVDGSTINGLSDEDLDYLLSTAKSILTDKNDWESAMQRSPRSGYSPLYGG